MEHLSFAPAEALLERLRTAEREVVFFVGAPLTAPRPGAELGVPDVRGMVALVQEYLQRNNSPRAAQALATALQTADNSYQVAFQQLATVRSQDVANMLIRSAVLRSVHPSSRPKDGDATDPQRCEHLENDLDAWAYSPAVDDILPGWLSGFRARAGQPRSPPARVLARHGYAAHAALPRP